MTVNNVKQQRPLRRPSSLGACAVGLAVGLYAAGAAASHIPQSGKGYASGMSLGPGSWFGRVAGRHAAAAARGGVAGAGRHMVVLFAAR